MRLGPVHYAVPAERGGIAMGELLSLYGCKVSLEASLPGIALEFLEASVCLLVKHTNIAMDQDPDNR